MCADIELIEFRKILETLSKESLKEVLDEAHRLSEEQRTEEAAGKERRNVQQLQLPTVQPVAKP